MKQRGQHLLGRLNDRQVKTREPGTHQDGGGLRLVVDPTGARRFDYRFQLNGKRGEMGLGGYPAISLAEAREKAAEARRLVKQGINPIEARNAARAAEKAAIVKANGGMTFTKAAEEYIATAKAGITEKARKAWTQQIQDYCGTILNTPCERIERADVVAIFNKDKFWLARHELAKRLRYKIQNVLEFARGADEFCQFFSREWSNPAAIEIIKSQCGTPEARHVEGYKFIPPAEMPAFIAELRSSDTNPALLVEFIALTAVRSAEARQATWDEIDIDNAIWTIPPKRMKKRIPHKVPLTPRALKILEEMRGRSGGPFIFAGQKKGQPLGHSAARRLVVKICGGNDASPHGFRKSFKSWAAESGIRDDVSEKILAHTDRDKVRAAYMKSDLMKERRLALESWAKFINGTPAQNVLPFKKAE